MGVMLGRTVKMLLLLLLPFSSLALSYGRMGPTTLDSLLTTLNQGRALCSTLTGTYSPGSGRTRPSQAKGPTCSARVETTREAFLLGFLKDRASSIFTTPMMTGNTLMVRGNMSGLAGRYMKEAL